MSPVTQVRYGPPVNKIYNAGVVVGTIGDQEAYFWCADLQRILVMGCCYQDSLPINDTLTCIVNKYPASMGLSSLEKGAINAAIWSISDRLPVDLIMDQAMRERARQILDSSLMFMNQISYSMTIMDIIQDDFDPEVFRIRTKQNGNPVGIQNIHVYLTGNGTLNGGNSSIYVNTSDSSGFSEWITSSGTGNNSLLRASFPFLFHAGISLVYNNCIFVPEPGQRMILGKSVSDSIEAEFQTGLLPVELSSFFSILTDNSVSLVWTTEGETNNARFEIERRAAAGWSKVGEVQGNGTTKVPQTYSFIDRNLQSGTYSYRLKQIDFNGNYEYHNLNEEVNIGVPNDFELRQNYPNPFNPATKINFSLPTSGNVKLKIFDVSGKEVATLVNEYKPAGYYSIDFNGSNLASGMYFYRLESEGYIETKKMILMK